MTASDLFIVSDAMLSDCGLYRYLLRRIWDPTKPVALVVMLNPSTADATVNDATIRSLIRLLTALGYGGFEVVNLYGFRATDPKDLARAADPVGPNNDAILEAALGRCDMAIVAWGAHKMAAARQREIGPAIHHWSGGLGRYLCLVDELPAPVARFVMSACGDAVVCEVVEALGHAIMAADRELRA